MPTVLTCSNCENSIRIKGNNYLLFSSKDFKMDKAGCILFFKDTQHNVVTYTLTQNSNTKSVNGKISYAENCGNYGSISPLEKEVLTIITIAYFAEKSPEKAFLLKICYYQALRASLHGYLSDMQMRSDLELENFTKKNIPK